MWLREFLAFDLGRLAVGGGLWPGSEDGSGSWGVLVFFRTQAAVSTAEMTCLHYALWSPLPEARSSLNSIEQHFYCFTCVNVERTLFKGI